MDRFEKVKLPTLPLSLMFLVSPTLHTLAASPESLAALMAAQVLLVMLSLNRFTVTEQVLFPGALWFVPAATLTVMVVVPYAFAVTVMVVPETLTVAIPVSPEVAVIAPSPALVTVMVLVFVVLFRVRLLLLRDRLPAAFPMLQLTVLAVVSPPLHW